MSKTMTMMDLIHKDIDDSHTFDMPLLRYYGGAIPVFLWDDLQDYPEMIKQIPATSTSAGYKYMTGRAFTKELLLPWYNMSMDLEEFTGFCLGHSEDLNALDLDPVEQGALQPIAGKMVGMSLEAIRQLDIYYENEVKYTRRLIEVIPQSLANKGMEPLQAYAYFNVLDDLATYNKMTNEWTMRSGMDLLPFKDNGGVYEC